MTAGEGIGAAGLESGTVADRPDGRWLTAHGAPLRTALSLKAVSQPRAGP